jgi:heme A synthase
MQFTDIHARLANTAVLFCVIMAVWGGWRFIRKQGVDSSFWGAAVIGEILILVQGILGAFLWISGLRPARGGMHILYGVVSLLAIPLVYAYTKGREERPEMLIYTIAFLILAGLLLRAIVTGA